MKFLYTVSSSSCNIPILKVPCPYIVIDFAKAFLQQYIINHYSVKELPDGMYRVDLFKDILPISPEAELSNTFTKDKDFIEFIERPYGL